MSALADELDVNRVTLYRWVGSRDQLLVEVVWSLAEQGLETARREATGDGPERVADTLTRFLELVIGNAGMQRWLAEEGEHAMRLLTRRDTGFQPRLIAAVQDLLAGVLEDDEDAVVDRRELAYVLVRLVESYVYLDLITGEQPDAQRARPILSMLLEAAAS